MDTALKEGSGFGLLVLLVIVALGVAGAILRRQVLGRVPPLPLPGHGPLEGTVLEKLQTLDWLLLKVETEAGVVLATFTEMSAEIDRLVAPGDVVALDIRRYRPTVEDPRILNVRRSAPLGDGPARVADGEERRDPGRPGGALPLGSARPRAVA